MPSDDPTQPQKPTDGLDSVDSELIGLVYEVAFDPFFWPDLLEGLAVLFETTQTLNTESSLVSKPESNLTSNLESNLESNLNSNQEAHRLTTLLPHLYKALKLKRNFNETDHTRGQAQALLDKFPVGLVLVTAQAKIVSANQHAVDALDNCRAVTICEDILSAVNSQQDQQLKQHIDTAATSQLDATAEQLFFIKLETADQQSTISLLIAADPYTTIQYDQNAEHYAAIFIASSPVPHTISEATLQTLYELSPAEARLAALLASGDSLTQAAEHSFISKNTAKVQLKSVFSKMHITRQAELIKKILTSPAVFNPSDTRTENSPALPSLKPPTHINNESRIVLSDGRQLQYAEYGDPDGVPIFHLHGILGCRYERLPDDALTTALNVRLIIPDRHGYGGSDFNPEHGYLEYAHDLLALIDHLKLQKISIMGHSVGAIYGSAFAYRYPQRVTRVAMISSTPPFRSFADFSGVPASLKLLIAFSKYLPSAAQKITEIAIKNACANPTKFLATIPICNYDQRVFKQNYLRDHIELCLLAGSKDQHDGFVHDILLSAKPWPFSVADIQTEIHFWHGSDDSHSPITRIKPIIDTITNKQFTKIESAGHFLIYEYWQDIIKSLIQNP